MNDSWYLRAGAYYVDPTEADSYPCRQGDVFPGLEVNGERWTACQLVHPSCELNKTSVSWVQVIRVHKIAEVDDANQQSAICAGWLERDGQIRVAFANTFFLAPVGSLASQEPLFSNFRDITLVPRDAVLPSARLAALTHDARVTFIRRMIYFAFRLKFSPKQVQDWEAARIGNDPDFQGPKPDWASKPSGDQGSRRSREGRQE